MDIRLFDTLPSTQSYLLDLIQNEQKTIPDAVLSLEQSSGVGSRDNKWSGGKGNFFASIAIPMERLPKDLSLASASIYFSFIMKQVLVELGEEVWLKWPNDFYYKELKIGGTITKQVKNILVCGIGINLKKSQNGYEALESDISPQFLLEKYFLTLNKFPKWKDIFSEFEVEFELSKGFSVHIERDRKSLKHAVLQPDGSLIINKNRIYSLR